MREQLKVRHRSDPTAMANVLKVHSLSVGEIHEIDLNDTLTVAEHITVKKAGLQFSASVGTVNYALTDALLEQEIVETGGARGFGSGFSSAFNSTTERSIWGGTFVAMMYVRQKQPPIRREKVTAKIGELFIRPNASPELVASHLAAELSKPRLPLTNPLDEVFTR